MSTTFYENQLPSNFAELLLNCEIEVELAELVPKQLIMEILQLYSKAMEYFESMRSYKYLYFQRKMNSIMRSPKIIHSMSTQTKQTNNASACNSPSTSIQSSPTHTHVDFNKQDHMKILVVKQQYQKMYNDYIGQTAVLTGDKIKKIVADNQVKLNEVKESIKGQISQQENRLKLKIQRRKFQNATKKSMSVSKSTKDTLFEDDSLDKKEAIDSDFTTVINEFELEVNDSNLNLNINTNLNLSNRLRQNRTKRKHPTTTTKPASQQQSPTNQQKKPLPK